MAQLQHSLSSEWQSHNKAKLDKWWGKENDYLITLYVCTSYSQSLALCVCASVCTELLVCSSKPYQAFITKSHLGLMVPVHLHSGGLKAPEKCGKGPSFVKRSCSIQRLSLLTPIQHAAHLYKHIHYMLICCRTPPRSFLLPPGPLSRTGWGGELPSKATCW